MKLCGIAAVFQCPRTRKHKDSNNCQKTTKTRMLYDPMLGNVIYSFINFTLLNPIRNPIVRNIPESISLCEPKNNSSKLS